jgi:hypothetical protein
MWAIAKSSALGGIPEWTLDRSLTPRGLRLIPLTSQLDAVNLQN